MDILSPAELLDLVGRFGAEPLVQTINAQVIGVTTSCGGAGRGPPRKVTTAAHMTLSQMVSVYISASSNTFAALTGACATFEELILQHLVSAGFGGKYGSLAVLKDGRSGSIAVLLGLCVVGSQHAITATVLAVPPGDGRLRMFSLVWTAHRLVTEWLVRLFSPADPGEPFNSDRMNTIGFKRPVSLTSWAHRQFKAVVFEKARDMLVESVHDAMNRDREGGVTDRTVAKNAIDMFLLMGVCDTDAVQNLRNDLDMRRRVMHSAMAVNESFIGTFQQPIVAHTITYYHVVANSAMEVLDVPAYLHLVRAGVDWCGKSFLAVASV